MAAPLRTEPISHGKGLTGMGFLKPAARGHRKALSSPIDCCRYGALQHKLDCPQVAACMSARGVAIALLSKPRGTHSITGRRAPASAPGISRPIRRVSATSPKLAPHQDARKRHAWPQRHIDRPDRLKAGRPIEAFGAECRMAMQPAYAGEPSLAEGTSKERGPDAPPDPGGMSCKVTDVGFPFDDLCASRPRRGPAAAPDNIAVRRRRNVVAAGRKERRIGSGQKRQGAAERIGVIVSRKQARIAGDQQCADRIGVRRSGDPD
jgi:hypothetical protein